MKNSKEKLIKKSLYELVQLESSQSQYFQKFFS